MTTDPITKSRAAWLVDLAWAGGEADLQLGWWPHVSHELDALEAKEPGVKARALAELKARREAVAA